MARIHLGLSPAGVIHEYLFHILGVILNVKRIGLASNRENIIYFTTTTLFIQIVIFFVNYR